MPKKRAQQFSCNFLWQQVRASFFMLRLLAARVRLKKIFNIKPVKGK
jgi:hypothetical protein